MNMDNKNNYENDWFKLDNVSKIFAPIISAHSTTVFRLSVTLKEPIKVNNLQQALINTIKRFPYFQVYLRRGFFWYYLERTNDFPNILPESKYPCEKIPVKGRKIFLFRVRSFKNRISCEFCHILTDGMGAINFLKTLTAEYLTLTYEKFDDWGDIIKTDSNIDPEEFEDASLKYYQDNAPHPKSLSKAFHLPFKLLKPGIYYVITGITPIDKIEKIAKEKKVTINDILLALLFDSYQEFFYNNKKYKLKKRPIRIITPINLRKLFPSKTMRNFIHILLPEIDLRLGKFTFDEILNKVHHYVRIESTKKSILPYLSRNVKGEKYPFVRIVPRFIKDLYLNFVHYMEGDRISTTSLSNLGVVKMPDKMSEYIEYFDFIPSPDPALKCSCGVISFKDKICISFGRIIKESEIEKIFFTKLIKLGIPIKIISNY